MDLTIRLNAEGVQHCDSHPALVVEHENETVEMYYERGLLHRVGGPAVVVNGQPSAWFLYGTKVPRWLAESTECSTLLSAELDGPNVLAVAIRRFGLKNVMEKIDGTVIDANVEFVLFKVEDAGQRYLYSARSNFIERIEEPVLEIESALEACRAYHGVYS